MLNSYVVTSVIKCLSRFGKASLQENGTITKLETIF